VDDQPFEPRLNPSRLSLAFGGTLLAFIFAALSVALIGRARESSQRYEPFTAKYLIDEGLAWWRLRDACADDPDPRSCATRSARLRHYRFVVGEPGFNHSVTSFDNLKEARRFVESKNAALRRSRRKPTTSEFFPEPLAMHNADGSCASRGLRTYETKVDLDADGKLDRFIAYSTGDSGDWGADTTEQYLRVELATGAVADTHVEHEWGWRALGSTDVNDDGEPEIWMLVGHGNKGEPIYGLAVFKDCTPQPVKQRYTDGVVNAWLLSGNSYGAGGAGRDGVECTDIDGDADPEIVQTSQSWSRDAVENGLRYRGWEYTAFDIRGDVLVEVQRRHGTEESELPDTLHWASAELSCDGVDEDV
jgi:hypothetical protein